MIEIFDECSTENIQIFMQSITYTIKETPNTYILYSIVKTNFGGDAKNYIAEFPKDELEYYLKLLNIKEYRREE